MWRRRKQTKKESLIDEAAPRSYKSAPPGYNYWSPTPSSSPNYYRKRIGPDEALGSSGWSFRRKVISIVLFAILVIDLLALFYGGYLTYLRVLIPSSGIILWAVVGLIAAIGLLASAYDKIFSRRVRRTISRNAPLVSALFALVGVLIAQTVNAHLTNSTQENQRMQDEKARLNSELQNYLYTVGNLPTNPDPAADTSAQAQTLTVLPDLSGEQKRTVMQFLYQAGLITKDKPRISLYYADLTSANLKGIDPQENMFVLDNVNLRGINLQDADLDHISLKGSDVSQAHLVNTNLSDATLSDVNLEHSYLSNVDLSGATLSGADLSGTNLQTATGLTQEQIDEAKGDGRTQLPDDLQRPANWS